MPLSAGKGNSRARTTSTSSTSNYIDNSVTMVDAGVLEAATDVIGRSLDAAETLHSRSTQFAGDAVSDALSLGERSVSGVLEFADRAGERNLDAIDAVSDAGADALSFGKSIFGEALDALTGSQGDALNFADRQNTRLADLFTGAGDMLASAYENAFDTASDVLKEGQAQVATTVSNLNAISRQASTSDAERNQAIVKYALIAAAVMVVAFAMRS